MIFKCKTCGNFSKKFKTDERKSYKEFKYVDENGHVISGKKCHQCKLDETKSYRSKTKNECTKKYEKTKTGFLMRAYRNMKSRISGIQKEKHYLYKGKELLQKEQFYLWSLHNEKFNSIFLEWEKSGYERKKTPSIDRIDSRQGYVFGNMRWVYFSENCSNIKRREYDNQSLK